MSDCNVKEYTQIQAEKTFSDFMLWTKRISISATLCLVLVIVGCNNGVDGTGSAYNGEQYSPSNISVNK